MRYIHYGADKYEPGKFKPIVNCNYDWTKPRSGGLWASPVDAEWGWKQWCSSEDFETERLVSSFTFTLSPEARVCHVRTINDLRKLPKRQHMINSMYYLIDFEKAMQEYDAIELHLSEDIGDSWEGSLYFKLYGWDCDSILIMNPEVIVA